MCGTHDDTSRPDPRPGGAGSLARALNLGSREHVAVMGGGGKSTLLDVLAGQLVEAGHTVVLTTTTKMRHSEARRTPHVVFCELDGSWREAAMRVLACERQVFVAARPFPPDKVEGLNPALVDELWRDERVDFVLVEADGSAGRPVKAPADHEPVVPATCTVAIGLMGLEAVDRRATPEVVFRMERFSEVTGTAPNELLTPGRLARVFTSPDGVFRGVPRSCRKVVLLNKADLLHDRRRGIECAHRIFDGAGDRDVRVVMGSLFRNHYTTVERQP